MRFTPNYIRFFCGLALAVAAAMACGSDDSGLVQSVVYVAEDRDGYLFILDQDGKEKEVASEVTSAPAWAPNLNRIAYIARAGENGGELKYWDRDGGSKPILEPSDKVKRFSWSPDSQMVAYQRESDDGSKSEIRVYDFKDESNTLVTSEPRGMLELGNWSGDNEWIVIRIETAGDSAGIFMRSVKGVDEKRLTSNEDSHPRFSPDGKRVAFNRSMSDGSSEIYLLTLNDEDESSAPENISRAKGEESDFEWSPNGRHIVYVSSRDGNRELYSIDVKDDGITSRLTENRVEDSNPRWSRNGSHILFLSNVDGDFDIFSMEFKSRSQIRLLDTDENERPADW